MISFYFYQIFYTVAQYGSITAASHVLNLTQPTVSHAVQNLEQSLGCSLFVRTRKGILLTPEAEKLYKDIAPACRRMQKAEADFHNRISLSEGQIRLGASEITLRHFLLPYLKTFRQTHPSIRLRLSNSTTPDALASLKSGELDCAVLVIDPADEIPGLHLTQLASFQDMVIAGPGFARLKGHPISLSDLNTCPLITMAEGSNSRSFLDMFFLRHRLTLQPEIETATADLIPPLVENGLGVGFVPPSFASDSIRTGNIFSILLKEEIPSRHICIVQKETEPISAAAQAFLNVLSFKS